MSYYANFVNNNDQLINITILVPNSSTNTELVLAGEPVIIQQESDCLFSPVKSQSCTISIMTDSALWDLYTTDPQAILVNVGNKTTGKTLFIGYATPCQYGQDWTSLDVLSLECVDILSSLKAIPYRIRSTYPEYVPADELISHLLALTLGEYDQMYHSYHWFWPKHNFSQANGNDLSTTADLLHAIKMNESNFFDDDEEHTPWTCYEVLEEVCKFFNVTAVPYEGTVWFIDYFYAASNNWGSTYDFWEYTLDMDLDEIQKSKALTINKSQYAAGTTAIGTDDFYNVISVNANRYDLSELTTDIYDDDKHISITKECNFGGNDQLWTQAHENFWGTIITDANFTTYKQYCRLKPETGWTHKYWNTMNPNATVNSYYNSNSTVTSSTEYDNLPENKWLNTIGAWILHYAHVDNQTTKPSKLDWKDVIMFQCLTDTCFSGQGGSIGYLYVQDIFDRRYEKPVLEYTMPYELCFSPKDGKSWIVINNALWYQQNRYDNMPHNPWSNSQIDVDLYPTNTNAKTQTMYPIEEVTNAKSYYARQWYLDDHGNPSSEQYSVPSNCGWSLCQYKLQIGNKYWNGSIWTTTESTFYIKYSGEASDASEGNYNFAYLSWMKPTNNATYQDQVGTDGYAIPIEASDKVSGQMKLTIYTPRLLPREWEYSRIADEIISWYERGPVVFMKDFKVDYVYTDSSNEWWLKHDKTENKDIKYSNETEDVYKYKKEDEMKINCWQDGNPIARSFPIIDFTKNGTSKKEFVATISDPTYYPAEERSQELNVINRQLRHYEEPRKKVDVHRHSLMLPWQRVLFNLSTSGLSGTYVVDSQELDVKNNVATTHLVEFGDTNIYTKE